MVRGLSAHAAGWLDGWVVSKYVMWWAQDHATSSLLGFY